MNINKNLLLATAIIGIGLFVLPSTLSMFAGQHSWYDPKNSGIPCQKCHFLEGEELSASGGPHDIEYTNLLNDTANYTGISGDAGGIAFWGGTNSINDRCYGCHQTTGTTNASSPLNDDWGNYNDTVHAAIAVMCIDCHPWVESELTHTNAAHIDFYNDLNTTTDYLQYSNKACIGCHTHVGVNISWTRAEYVSYNITVNKSGYIVTWNTSDELGTNTSQFNSSDPYVW